MTTDPEQQIVPFKQNTSLAAMQAALGPLSSPSAEEIADALWTAHLMSASQAPASRRHRAAGPGGDEVVSAARLPSLLQRAEGRPLRQRVIPWSEHALAGRFSTSRHPWYREERLDVELPTLRLAATARTAEMFLEVHDDGSLRRALPPSGKPPTGQKAFLERRRLWQEFSHILPEPWMVDEMDLTPRTRRDGFPSLPQTLSLPIAHHDASCLRSIIRRIPPAMAALSVRQEAARGNTYAVNSFADTYLHGLVPSPRKQQAWSRAISDALLDATWTEPLDQGGTIGPAIVLQIVQLARTYRRLETPLFARKILGQRTLSLDLPIGDGLSLYDLLPSSHASEPGGNFGLSHPVLEAIARRLKPEERAVYFARAVAGVDNWEEAALLAGAPEDAAYRWGERVRRKARRIRDEELRRHSLRHGSDTAAPGRPAGLPGGRS